jgi:hypothetical protein
MPMNIEKAHASLLKKVKEDPAFKAKVVVAAKRIVRMKLCTLK